MLVSQDQFRKQGIQAYPCESVAFCLKPALRPCGSVCRCLAGPSRTVWSTKSGCGIVCDRLDQGWLGEGSSGAWCGMLL